MVIKTTEEKFYIQSLFGSKKGYARCEQVSEFRLPANEDGEEVVYPIKAWKLYSRKDGDLLLTCTTLTELLNAVTHGFIIVR